MVDINNAFSYINSHIFYMAMGFRPQPTDLKLKIKTENIDENKSSGYEL